MAPVVDCTVRVSTVSVVRPCGERVQTYCGVFWVVAWLSEPLTCSMRAVKTYIEAEERPMAERWVAKETELLTRSMRVVKTYRSG
jgi:hypothetical protein